MQPKEELHYEMLQEKLQFLEVRLGVMTEHYQLTFQIDKHLFDNLHGRLCELENKNG